MSEVTSPGNPRVKYLKKLIGDAPFRRKEGVWAVEGVRPVEECVKKGLSVRQVVTDGDPENPRKAAVVKELKSRGAEVVYLSSGLFREFSGTVTPQGLLAVVDEPRWTIEDVIKGGGPVLILDNLRDPGNLGTIIRTGLALGGSGAILTGGTVDPGNPKALRASAGAALGFPFLKVESPSDARELLDLPIYATAGKGGTAPEKASLSAPFALVLGQEASGLEGRWEGLSDGLLTIPMEEGVESLNVATAAAAVLFEASRQRRHHF